MACLQGRGEVRRKTGGGGSKVRVPDRETEKPEASGVMKARENFQEGRFL